MEINMNQIETSIGMFNISMPSEIFQCKENPSIIRNQEGRLVIKSCLTKVVITMQDGTLEVIEPIVMASCMNPDIVSITPIAYEESEDTIYVSTPYKTIDIKGEQIQSVRTEDFEPKLKKNSCIPCRNCGRC